MSIFGEHILHVISKNFWYFTYFEIFYILHFSSKCIKPGYFIIFFLYLDIVSLSIPMDQVCPSPFSTHCSPASGHHSSAIILYVNTASETPHWTAAAVFHLTGWFPALSILPPMGGVHSLWWPSRIILCVYTTFLDLFINWHTYP